MKVMSFNTQHCKNYITKQIDFKVMADTILKCDADIVGLNEMRSLGADALEYDRQVEKLSELTGISNYYFAKAIEFPKGPYGNAFLSKLKIEKVETVIIPDPDPKGYDGYYETRCVLRAELEGGITVLVTHFGLNPDEHKNAVDTVLSLLPEKKGILMGDFNVLPDNEVLAPIRAKMRDTADMFEGEKFSFPSDTPDRKIDYIFVTPDVEVVSADIPEIVASDHRPHTAEINI